MNIYSGKEQLVIYGWFLDDEKLTDLARLGRIGILFCTRFCHWTYGTGEKVQKKNPEAQTTHTHTTSWSRRCWCRLFFFFFHLASFSSSPEGVFWTYIHRRARPQKSIDVIERKTPSIFLFFRGNYYHPVVVFILLFFFFFSLLNGIQRHLPTFINIDRREVVYLLPSSSDQVWNNPLGQTKLFLQWEIRYAWSTSYLLPLQHAGGKPGIFFFVNFVPSS